MNWLVWMKLYKLKLQEISMKHKHNISPDPDKAIRESRWIENGGTWKVGPLLPYLYGVKGHCMVALSDTEVLIAGGRGHDNVLFKETWWYNDLHQEFTEKVGTF